MAVRLHHLFLEQICIRQYIDFKSIKLLNEVKKLARRTDDSEFVKEYDVKEHKFMTMEEERRERIIDAALKEFSKGYTAASTDVIVKEAGISKGLLFHYFGSKRGFFLFLIKYASDLIIAEYEKVISESCDFLENIRRVSKLKVELSSQYPLEIGVLTKAYAAMKEVFPEGLPGDLLNSPLLAIQQVCQRSHNDRTLFKEGIDEEKAKNIMIWTINGLLDSQFRYGDDIAAYKAHSDELVKGLEEYLQILRTALYR
ncbi:MAG: TetR/AcrR family transcriptional regulator [Paenibacillus macerans]|nr:TetR/AcrR family transcriptional regulator [Paenibacillus macerans]MCY7560836.1 TetR/AcrR family transcriptional regulator [Paenibacillus macerans]MDU7477064.1 TetR/AcrR family transcriptional regulator [Paenibacillus macerans]MEC0152244.1 TetR/AcrR family transcriptional regulator [Paenibacillus macerans]SUA83505.1 TetR family transcriptional regulator [Paenibacillus macerans]